MSQTCTTSKNHATAGVKSAAPIDIRKNSKCPPSTLRGPNESQNAPSVRASNNRALPPSSPP